MCGFREPIGLWIPRSFARDGFRLGVAREFAIEATWKKLKAASSPSAALIFGLSGMGKTARYLMRERRDHTFRIRTLGTDRFAGKTREIPQ